jgi:hypothetical protein
VSWRCKGIAQYCFEEICAKSIYNESGHEMPAPFDSDSPFWVVPLAIQAARALGIDQDHVLTVVAGYQPVCRGWPPAVVTGMAAAPPAATTCGATPGRCPECGAVPAGRAGRKAAPP